MVSLDHVGLQVRDLQAARRFYEGVLGLQFVREKELSGGAVRRLLFLEGDGFLLELLHCPDVAAPCSFHFSFQVPSVTQVMDAMQREGLELTEPLREAMPRTGDASWVRAVFTGPAGEKLEFVGPE